MNDLLIVVRLIVDLKTFESPSHHVRQTDSILLGVVSGCVSR